MVGHHSRKPDSGYKLTQHSHYKRIRIGNLVIWQIQCKLCKVVFTVLPHFVLRYQSMPITIARQSLFALYGGLSLEYTATLFAKNAMTEYRLLCGFGKVPKEFGLSVKDWIERKKPGWFEWICAVV